MVPRNTVRVEGADAERIVRLMDVLEELDDVSRFFPTSTSTVPAGRGGSLRLNP